MKWRAISARSWAAAQFDAKEEQYQTEIARHKEQRDRAKMRGYLTHDALMADAARRTALAEELHEMEGRLAKVQSVPPDATLAAMSIEARRGIENEHSTDVESTTPHLPPPRFCMSVHLEGSKWKACSDLGSSAVLNDLPARTGGGGLRRRSAR